MYLLRIVKKHIAKSIMGEVFEKFLHFF